MCSLEFPAVSVSPRKPCVMECARLYEMGEEE